MGVPALFAYVARRFRGVVFPCAASDDVSDFLYVDMNGVIHACTHPEHRPHPPDESAMLEEICIYVDKLVQLARPQRAVFLAIDGVAPCFKMRQQRCRRFLAVKERAMRKSTNADTVSTKRFDHTVITPGTAFMAKVADKLRDHVVKHCSDGGWTFDVIISDASDPGEGEHKIMDLVRAMRAQPCYSPTQRHVVYGLDADLILLGLCTHEVRWKCLREHVEAPGDAERCGFCHDAGHGTDDCPRKTDPPPVAHRPFDWLDVGRLREGLCAKLETRAGLTEGEQALDDFVGLAALAGNDFLPHLPGLEVHAGAMDNIAAVQRRCRRSGAGPVIVDGGLNKEGLAAALDALAARDEVRLAAAPDTGTANAQGATKSRSSPLVGSKSEAAARARASEYARTLGPGVDTHKVCRDYLRALAWVVAYYWCAQGLSRASEGKGPHANGEHAQPTPSPHVRACRRGCPSWEYAYPHFYAPFAYDLARTLEDMTPAEFGSLTTFHPGRPARPLVQLVSVLPPESAWCLPEALRPIMDAGSELGDLFPANPHIDMHGKTELWQGVMHLPLVPLHRVNAAVERLDEHLTPEDRLRDEQRPATLVCSCAAPGLGEQLANALAEGSHRLPLISDERCAIPGSVMGLKAFGGALVGCYTLDRSTPLRLGLLPGAAPHACARGQASGPHGKRPRPKPDEAEVPRAGPAPSRAVPGKFDPSKLFGFGL